MYIINYDFTPEDVDGEGMPLASGELTVRIEKNGKVVYTGNFVGEFEDDADMRWTAMNAAKAHDCWPAYFSDDRKIIASKAGKASIAKLTPEDLRKRNSKAGKASAKARKKSKR